MMEEGFAQQLKAWTGVDVSPVVLPENVTPPHITYQVVSDVDDPALDGTSPRSKRMQIDCWAATYAGAKTLAKSISDNLSDFIGALPDGTQVMFAEHINAVDNFENDSELFRVMLDFRIAYNEAT